MYYDKYSEYIYNYLQSTITPLLQSINSTLSNIYNSFDNLFDYIQDNTTILLFILFTILTFSFIRKRWFIND